MSWLGHILADVSHWMRGYLFEIAMALVATVIGMFNNEINRYLKQRLKSAGFVIRFGVFVLVMAFGYGMATIALAKFLESVFHGMGARTLAPVVLLCFLGLALLAERKNQV